MNCRSGLRYEKMSLSVRINARRPTARRLMSTASSGVSGLLVAIYAYNLQFYLSSCGMFPFGRRLFSLFAGIGSPEGIRRTPQHA